MLTVLTVVVDAFRFIGKYYIKYDKFSFWDTDFNQLKNYLKYYQICKDLP